MPKILRPLFSTRLTIEDSSSATPTGKVAFADAGTEKAAITYNRNAGEGVDHLLLSTADNTCAIQFRIAGVEQVVISNRELRLPAASGGNYVGLKAPNSLAGNVVWILPVADGSNGQVLSTNGSGVLSWVDAGGGAGVNEAFFWGMRG